MDSVFKKLNYKEQNQVFILNAPASFEQNIDSILDKATIKRSIEENDTIEFIVCFLTKQTEIDSFVPLIAQRLKGDAIAWLCYPKGSSKKYKADINRDKGWAIVGDYDLEPVRAVAIDEDWSALRFRKVAFIKTLTRSNSFALSKAGKEKTRKD